MHLIWTVTWRSEWDYMHERVLSQLFKLFFKDFKYIEACINCVKSLIMMPFRKMLYTVMRQSFFETTQKRGKCIVQKVKSVFTFWFSNTQNCVTLHYWEIFLYIMQYLCELSLRFTKIELKQIKRKIWMIKNLNKSAMYELADLMKQLKFKSVKISDLITKYFSHAGVQSQFKLTKSTFIVNKPEECWRENVHIHLT